MFCHATNWLRKKFMLHLSAKSVQLSFRSPRLDCGCSNSIKCYDKDQVTILLIYVSEMANNTSCLCVFVFYYNTIVVKIIN